MIEEYLQPEVPVLHGSTTIETALQLMADAKLAELPLVEEKQLITLIKEEWLEEAADSQKPLSSLAYPPFKPVVYLTGHPYEAAQRMLEFDLHMLPVLGKDELYIGVVTRSELMHYFSGRSSLNQAGGIIVVSISALDYSLSEIARICENNDISVLNVQAFHHSASNRIEVTLKVNKRELQPLAATFERYAYTVEATYGDTPAQDDLRQRFDLLMNYLKM